MIQQPIFGFYSASRLLKAKQILKALQSNAFKIIVSSWHNLLYSLSVRRHSQVVRQGSAKPSPPVQIWVPPSKTKKILCFARDFFCFYQVVDSASSLPSVCKYSKNA